MGDAQGEMNRILFESCEVSNGRAVFGGARAEHVLNVLHGEVGQTLRTGVVDGLAGTSVIEAIEPLPADPATGLAQGRITVECRHDEPSPAPWADLILAPPRPRAMKRLLPQIAQMGVGRIVLVGAEKVEKAFWGAQLLKESVYRPLLLDGLMQAGVTAMPTIRQERSLRRYVEQGRMDDEFPDAACRVVAHPGVAAASAPSHGTGRVLVAIGPEGGWTDGEVALLESHGFSRLSLGPRILRTDTAVVALLARLMPIL